MEDTELDDFFAKKDKSKKKAKAAKFTASDILAKQSERPRKAVKKKKDKDKSNISGSTQCTKKENEDDEWVDYEEETEKDFSDLKIHKLQIGKDEDGGCLGDASEGDGEGGEGRERKEAASGPWNKSSAQTTTVDTPETAPPVEKEPPPPPKEPQKPTGKYVPPAVRQAMEAGVMPGSFRVRKKKQAPDVMSEEDFPTLGGAVVESSADSAGPASVSSRFEQVRGSGRQTDDSQGQSQRLEIGNKFDALSGADS